MNKIILTGRICQDAEVKQLNERQVMSFSMVTSETWKDKNGEKQEEAIFHNISKFGNNMENFAKYLTKGKAIEVIGKQINKYDKENKKTYSSVRANDINFSLGNSRKKEEPITSVEPTPSNSQVIKDIIEEDNNLPF